MKNKIEQIEQLKKDAQTLNNKAYNLEQEEINKTILPKLKKLVGVCMVNNKNTFMKILEWGENEEYGLFFILEKIRINEQGEVSLLTTSEHPYTNKEWWDAEIPLYGVSKISTEFYEKKKSELLNEMTTRNKLRKFLKAQK